MQTFGTILKSEAARARIRAERAPNERRARTLRAQAIRLEILARLARNNGKGER